MQRALAWIGGALACVAMFEIPSAYAAARGAPWWLCLTIGLLVFPVLPVAWHIYGERNGRDKKRQTTRLERFVLRTAAIAVLVIGGLVAFARGDTWRGIRNHTLWMIPGDGPGLLTTSDAVILQHLPDDAQAIIWLRPNDDLRAAFGSLSPAVLDAPELVGVITTSEAAVFERGETDVVDLLGKLADLVKRFDVKTPPPTQTTLPDGTHVFATPGWARQVATGGGARPAALLGWVRKAPSDAFLVVATTGYEEITGGVGYVRASADELELVAEVDTDTAAHAQAEVDKLQRSWAKHRDDDCLDPSTYSMDVTTAGAHVHARFAVQLTAIKPAVACLDKK